MLYVMEGGEVERAYWVVCDTCGKRDWIYTERHLAAVQRHHGRNWGHAPGCPGQLVPDWNNLRP